MLRLLCTMEGLSRTEITKRTGLAKMTVTNIVGELMGKGLIRETEPISPEGAGAGRKQMALSLTENAPGVIGIWLSRDFCKGIGSTLDCKELTAGEIHFDEKETGKTILKKLQDLACSLKEKAGREIIGAGIASIGPLELREGRLLNPPNFYGIENLQVGRVLSEALGFHVYLQNDMNAAALAELVFGSCTEVRNFGYVGITNGIGAGIVADGRLFEGARGFAGEFGHMSIALDGPLCTCGSRGCLETYCSAPRALSLFDQETNIPLPTFEALCRFCETDDRGRKWMEGYCLKLAAGLASFCNLFDPAVVVIGHEGAAMTDKQLSFLSEIVNRKILGKSMARVELRRSAFGPLAPVTGAAVSVLQKVFEGKLCYDTLFEADGG